MEEIYPLNAATTLSLRAEELGHVAYPSPVSSLAFDCNEEVLWCGTEDGRLTVLHSPSLERYSGVQAHLHDHPVLSVAPLHASSHTHGMGPGGSGGAISLSATHACFHSVGCVKHWGVGEGVEDPEGDPLTCIAVDPHAGVMGTHGAQVYVGRTSPSIVAIDVGTGKVSARHDVSGASCVAGTAVMAGGAPRGTVACGGFGGELVLRDPRSKMRAEVQLASPAHAAGVAAMAVKGDLVVTCGYAADRTGAVVVDPFVKVIDVRVGARVLNVLQFHAGPVGVSFNPKYSSSVLLTSASGLVQAMDVGGQGGGGMGFQNHMLQLEGYHLMAQDVSRSGETAAFGDSQGLIHIWGVNAAPKVNLYSRPTEVPPYRPPCVAASFQRVHAAAAAMQGVPGTSAEDADFARERSAIPPAPFHLAADGGLAPPMSYLDPSETIVVGRAPRVIPKEVLKTVKQVDFVGYAANPHYKRGGVRGEAYRAAAPLQNKRAESRSQKEDAKKLTAAKGYGASATPLPKLYHRVEVRLSASRARFEDFDFSFYNRTRLPGLANDLANCYVNPVLQMLHFVPELRARVLMGHTCEREFCLTCELAFLSHMLSQPPSPGGGSHGMSSITAQPLNFLRTLRQVREAAALGLIEGKDELEARLDQSYARRIQAFQRFILEQLHKEEGAKDDKPTKVGGGKVGGGRGGQKGDEGGGKVSGGGASNTAAATASMSKGDQPGGAGAGTAAVCGGVESLFALSSKQTHRCAQCSREETRAVRSFQTDLQYPGKEHKHAKGSAAPTFASCLARSLATTQEVRAWCEGHQAYTRMHQARVPTRLPQVMSINLGMRDVSDLKWWGVDVNAPVSSEKAKAPVETHWLPQYVHVVAKDKGVTVTEATEDVDSLDTDPGGVTYELTALVCLARRPGEEEDDDRGGVDETGARKLCGHLVAFLKVTPPYVEQRGQFAAAPHVPGMSPGVSPIPTATATDRSADRAASEAVAAAAVAAAAAVGKAEASAAASLAPGGAEGGTGGERTNDQEKEGGGEAPTAGEPSTPGISKTSCDEAVAAEIAAEEAAAGAVAAKRKAAQFAAALAAGEAMYGPGSGFENITPSQMFTPSAGLGGVGTEGVEGTDWLLFNDFSINPVAPREVTRLYGQVKLPCLCMYTRVDRPAPPPLPPSPITADLYRRLTLDANLPSRFPFRPFDFESPEETPKPGTILGIDAEFVALAPAVKETDANGVEHVVQSMRLGLARVSVVRGDKGRWRLVPIIDDYIRAVEPVYDYLTRFSGLVPGDLDPAVSKHHITKLKHAYLKLRYLVDCGCIFVGHGLKQDFKMINIVVPPAQIVDTVELFHFKRQRKLSLRFLASYLLNLDIQQETHDSIEDARTAIRLYEKYLELVTQGNFQAKLLEIYRFGKQYGFTGEVRPSNVPQPAGAPPPRDAGQAKIDDDPGGGGANPPRPMPPLGAPPPPR